jgi:hypothetical protein
MCRFDQRPCEFTPQTAIEMLCYVSCDRLRWQSGIAPSCHDMAPSWHHAVIMHPESLCSPADCILNPLSWRAAQSTIDLQSNTDLQSDIAHHPIGMHMTLLYTIAALVAV